MTHLDFAELKIRDAINPTPVGGHRQSDLAHMYACACVFDRQSKKEQVEEERSERFFAAIVLLGRTPKQKTHKNKNGSDGKQTLRKCQHGAHRLPKRHEHDRLHGDELCARSERLQILASGHVKPHEAVERRQLRKVLQQRNVRVAFRPVDLTLAIAGGGRI